MFLQTLEMSANIITVSNQKELDKALEEKAINIRVACNMDFSTMDFRRFNPDIRLWLEFNNYSRQTVLGLEKLYFRYIRFILTDSGKPKTLILNIDSIKCDRFLFKDYDTIYIKSYVSCNQLDLNKNRSVAPLFIGYKSENLINIQTQINLFAQNDSEIASYLNKPVFPFLIKRLQNGIYKDTSGKRKGFLFIRHPQEKALNIKNVSCIHNKILGCFDSLIKEKIVEVEFGGDDLIKYSTYNRLSFISYKGLADSIRFTVGYWDYGSTCGMDRTKDTKIDYNKYFIYPRSPHIFKGINITKMLRGLNSCSRQLIVHYTQEEYDQKSKYHHWKVRRIIKRKRLPVIIRIIEK